MYVCMYVCITILKQMKYGLHKEYCTFHSKILFHLLEGRMYLYIYIDICKYGIPTKIYQVQICRPLPNPESSNTFQNCLDPAGIQDPRFAGGLAQQSWNPLPYDSSPVHLIPSNTYNICNFFFWSLKLHVKCQEHLIC